MVQASSLSAAEMYLENKNIHLAIIDIRMKDDNDEKDISGLIFAQKNAYRAIPKIILTGFTSLTYVREVMRPSSVGLPAAVDFVAKQDGPGVLVTAIKRVFDEIVHINWKLRIEWAFHINQFSMVSIINPNLDEEKLINHAEELEDLFRRLFFEKDLIRIEQVLWQHKGRIALTVLAFREGTKFESYIVVCGNSNTVNEEIRRYNEFSPRSHGESSTTLVLSKETTHYAACVYSLTTNQLEVIKNLRDLYNSGPEKIFNLSITNLFQNTLRIWHQDKLINLNTHTAYDLYTEKLYLSKDWLTAESFNNRLRGVEQKALALGITLEQSMMGLKIHYKEQSFSLANPSTAIVEAIGDVKSTIAIITSGTLSGKNILVDEFGRTWLTDFHEAGRARNYGIL